MTIRLAYYYMQMISFWYPTHLMDLRICLTHCTAGPKRGCLRLIMTNMFQYPRYATIRHNRMGEHDDIDSYFCSGNSIRNLSNYILDCLKLRVWSTAIIDSLYCLHKYCLRQISVVNILTCSYDDRTYTGGVIRSILNIIDDMTIRTAALYGSYHQPVLGLWICIVYTLIAGFVIPALIPTTLGLRWLVEACCLGMYVWHGYTCPFDNLINWT